MDSNSGATNLVRPRVVVAALTAVLTVGVVSLTLGRHAIPDWLGGGGGADSVSGQRGHRIRRANAVRRLHHQRPANGRPPARGHHDDGDAMDGHDDEHAAGEDWPMGDGPVADGGGAVDGGVGDQWLFRAQQEATALGGGDGAGDGPIDDVATLDDSWLDDPAVQPAVSRDGQNIIGLLFRVSEDNARRSAYVHRGCACNACGVVPIRGIRYRCANCADFDLCETCELQGLHTKTHIFYKVRVPAPPFGTRQVVQPVWYTGDPDHHQQALPRSLIGQLMRETGFERQELEAYWEQWTYMANTEWREDPDELGLAMDRKTFDRCLVPSGGARHVTANLIHERMFAFYDTNGDGLIGFREFLHGLTYRKRKDKMQRIFDGYDTDGDGLVSRQDFLRFFRAYYVLYKQMHRDILDGFDDALNSVETRRHTTGRQPLSSMFGRDSTVPAADLQRMMPGKAIFGNTAEVGVVDETQGVCRDSTTDTAPRQDVLARLFMRPNRNRRPPLRVQLLGGGAGGHAGAPNTNAAGSADANGAGGEAEPGTGFHTEAAEHRYVEALVNPPMTVRDLPALLAGEQARALMTEEHFAMYLAGRNRHGDGAAAGGNGAAAASEAGEGEGGQRWAGVPLDSGLGRPQVAAAVSASQAQDHVQSQTPLRLTRGQMNAQNAAYVDRRISEEAKVSARQRLLERWQSRHFYLDEEEGAEPPPGWLDDDDLLARNGLLVLQHGGPSDSSSGPVAAATVADEEETPQTRSRSSSRVRFADDDTVLPDTTTAPSTASTAVRSVPERWGGMAIPQAERDAGKEVMYQVMQQSFNELLDILFLDKEEMAIEAAETQEDRDRYRHLYGQRDADGNYLADDLSGPGTEPTHSDSLENLLQESGYSVERRDKDDAALADGENDAYPADHADHADKADKTDKTASTLLSYSVAAVPDERDPTLPQFRPGTTQAAGGDHELPADVPWESFKRWRQIDMAEAAALADGGWGRLRFEEFERRCHQEEMANNRLDYLGSWIDFCIP